jgi:hypothetical protein
MPLAAATCHTTKKTINESTGSAARVILPRHLPVGAAVVGESTCDSSGAISANTDTVSDFLLAETERRTVQRQQESSDRVVTRLLVPAARSPVEI